MDSAPKITDEDRLARKRAAATARKARWRAANPELARERNRRDAARHRKRMCRRSAECGEVASLWVVIWPENRPLDERLVMRRSIPFCLDHAISAGYIPKDRPVSYRKRRAPARLNTYEPWSMQVVRILTEVPLGTS